MEERYDLSDALAVATFLNIFVRFCNVVEIANLAQMVNVIAPIFTSPEGMFLQTIYHPLRLYAEHTQPVALDTWVEAPMRDATPADDGTTDRDWNVADMGPFPLLDVSAHVIGVNSQIATAGSQGNVGIGFAVPANTVRQVVPILEKGGTIKRAYLGVQTGPPASGSGAQVSSTVPGGPASRGGLQVGDVIKSIGGKRVADPTQLSIIVAQKAPGDQVSIVVQRGGADRTLQVTLGTRPAGTASP